jgi:AcrR family transcriptional regulator
MRGKEKLSSDEACCAAPRRPAGERLRDVASDLFYKRGIRAVGVDEIVNETGVTKPTLYRSFASKDDLVAACLKLEAEADQNCLDEIAARFPGDPLAQIRAIVSDLFEEMADPEYRGCAIMNAAVEFPERDHPARVVAEECKNKLRERLHVLARELGVVRPEVLSDGLVLLMEGASTSRHTSGSQGPSATLMVAAEALIQACSGGR